jgi:hypothetical protein
MASSGPYNLPLSTALARSEALSALLQRWRESQARLAIIAPLLPPALLATVSAGPLDETTWVLLATNASAAAKLRQRVPEFHATLLAAGLATPSIKIKVSSST